ncbi:MAG: polysaccharide biosynthesis/export family protein [Candidatus Aminicenantales bacterium]
MRKLQEKAKKSRYTIPSTILVILIIFLISSVSQGEILGLQQESTLPVSDYRIGSKDLLEIKVFELPELNQTVRVSEDGSISLSLLGKVDVAGLTAQELEKKLASILDQKYTKAGHVTVFIKEYQKVSIMGAIGRPGNYELVGPTTLLQVILQAGGLTAQAMSELYVYRREKDGRKTRIAVNLEDLISGNQTLNIDLQPNDVVSIPIDQMLTVYVYGEVRNPGAIQFKQSKKITLLQAIAQAGGTTEWASKSRVMIKRKDKKTGKDMKIRANLKSIISGKTSDIVLEEGDIVIVP